MKLTVTPQDLHHAVTAGVLQPGQDQALLTFLRQRPVTEGSFQLSHVAYYFGAVLIMAAMGWLLTDAWSRIGDSALLAISGLYMAAFTLCGLSLYKRGQIIPGGLLGAVAVSLTPLLVFALQRLSGLWPLADEQGDYQDYYKYVQSGWLWMELATVVVGLLMLRLLPFPFITLPIAVALWFMSMDLTALLYGEHFSYETRLSVSLWFGLAVLLASLLVDSRTRQDFAFWGYLAGLLAFWGGLSLTYSDSEWSKAGYCLINLGLMAFAVLLRRPLFMVFGALGVACYLGYLSYEVFEDSLLFPIVLTLIGLGIIGLGLAYQKHRDAMSATLRAQMPASLLTLFPTLRQ